MREPWPWPGAARAAPAVARAMLADPTIPVAAIAKRLGVSRTTFYEYFPAARTRAQASQGRQEKARP